MSSHISLYRFHYGGAQAAVCAARMYLRAGLCKQNRRGNLRTIIL